MPLFKTSNPALGENTFRNVPGAGYGGIVDAANRMSLNGTVNKTGILLLCAIATAAFTWHTFLESRDFTDVAPWMLGGLFGGFICAMVTIFKKEWSPVTAPIYALLEGFVLGGISSLLELRYPGIAMEAVGLTFGTLFALLIIYRTGIIQVTQKFRIGVIAATGGIALFYMAEIVLGFFGVRFTTVNGSSPIGIASTWRSSTCSPKCAAETNCGRINPRRDGRTPALPPTPLTRLESAQLQRLPGAQPKGAKRAPGNRGACAPERCFRSAGACRWPLLSPIPYSLSPALKVSPVLPKRQIRHQRHIQFHRAFHLRPH